MIREPDTVTDRDIVEELREQIDDSELLERALTHGSWAHAEGNARNNYERLEFLGDSVLGLVIVDALYHRFPEEAEGNLSRAKNSLVSSTQLARLGRRYQLDKHVRTSGSPGGLSRRGQESILADVFEAVTGAVYLDQGYEVVHEWLIELFEDAFEGLDPGAAFADFKSALQERTQGILHERPKYEVEQESGPSHKPVFHAKVWLRELFLGEGRGPSKKIAQQNAASDALRRIEREEITLDTLLGG
jgi:ribonuclease-3